MVLNVVLRTCDRKSIESRRVVDKQQCVIRCLNSLVKSLKQSGFNYKIKIIDDGSTQETIDTIKKIAPEADLTIAEQVNEAGMEIRQKSRRTLKMAYDYIMTLPDDELVYIVEDDYLHYDNSIFVMVNSWDYFTYLFPDKTVGIFPQDFRQLYFDPKNPFNETYVKDCIVIPGPERYFRSTWFTHESFMVPINLIKNHQETFYKLLDIGTIDGHWEGNTISNVWNRSDVLIMMPMGTLAIHLGNSNDISYYVGDWTKLWEENKISL